MSFRRVALLVLLVSACANDKNDGTLKDGGGFVFPDSGYIYDGGPARQFIRDAGPPDTGPHECNPTCPVSQICGCLPSGGGAACGCHPRQGYAAACDPQVPESCKWPFDCVKARVAEGNIFLCSDGREGTPCSTTQDTCRTSNGCACLSTPFGTACSCQGDPGPSPLLCDPNVPGTCPDGTCVRVEGPNPFYICSDGAEHEPCVVGDGSCRTSLGCTCPFSGGRRVCRCSEPGTTAGDACDLMVMQACLPPLECAVRGDPIEGFYSECNDPNGMSGNDFLCDPMLPMCPPMYQCVEVRPDEYRCRPN